MRNGNLNKNELATLYKAWDILSAWSEWAEEHGTAETEEYSDAMTAVYGLCEFLGSDFAKRCSDALTDIKKGGR